MRCRIRILVSKHLSGYVTFIKKYVRTHRERERGWGGGGGWMGVWG